MEEEPEEGIGESIEDVLWRIGWKLWQEYCWMNHLGGVKGLSGEFIEFFGYKKYASYALIFLYIYSYHYHRGSSVSDCTDWYKCSVPLCWYW